MHTNSEYAKTLASAVESVDDDYEVTVVTREPVSKRIFHLLQSGYDLVQTDELMVNGVLSWFASKITHTPYVVSIRGWADYTNEHGDFGTFREKSIRLRSNLVLDDADHVIFISDLTRKKFTSQYPVRDSTTIGRPIDVDYYRTGTGGTSKNFELLTVTNLRYEKKYQGLKNILKGLTEIFPDYPRLRFTVAGGGTYLSNLQAYLDSYPFADRVDVVGFHDNVPELLANADLFVYVSFLDSFGTVVLEAQSTGLPVVVGNVSGVAEIVGDEGIKCPPTSDGIAQALKQVLQDEQLRNELSEKSRRKMDRYNDQTAKRHVRVWDSVLDR